MRDDEIVGYLLGELDPEARAHVEGRLRDDPAARAQAESLRALIGELEALPAEAWTAADVPPPPVLPREPARDAAPRRAAPRRVGWGLVAAAAAAMVAIAVAAGVLATRGGQEGPAIALARVDARDPGASGTARVSGGGSGTMDLRVSGLRPSGARDFYEVWLMDGPDRLVSLGGFRVPASGRVERRFPLPVAVSDFRYVDVSREPEDGVPAHSGVSVLRGPTSEAGDTSPRSG
jgi:anti-sigma-K factor RskA